MNYKVEFTEKQLKKLDRYTAAIIIGWIENLLYPQGIAEKYIINKKSRG